MTISIRNSDYGNSNDPSADRHHQHTADPVADRMLCSRFMSVGISCADLSRHQRRPNIDHNPANYEYPDNGNDQYFDRLGHFARHLIIERIIGAATSVASIPSAINGSPTFGRPFPIQICFANVRGILHRLKVHRNSHTKAE